MESSIGLFDFQERHSEIHDLQISFVGILNIRIIRHQSFLKDRDPATISRLRSRSRADAVALAREDFDNELLVGEHEEGDLLGSFQPILAETDQLLFLWEPASGSFSSRGTLEVDSLAEWLEHVHGSDQKKWDAFLDRDWRSEGGSVSG